MTECVSLLAYDATMKQYPPLIRWVVLVATFCVSFFFLSLAHAQGVGTPAPAFRLVDDAGQPIALADVMGEPVVLNVWATWCPPCRAELPLFEQTQAELASEVTFLLVNNNESAPAATQFLQQEGITLLAAFEPTRAQRNEFDLDTTRDVVRDYRVRGMPTTFFIDADGIIQAVKVGEVQHAELTELLATIGVTWSQDSAVTPQNMPADGASVNNSADDGNCNGNHSDDSDNRNQSATGESTAMPVNTPMNTSIDTPAMTVLGAVHGRISSQTPLPLPSGCGDQCPVQQRRCPVQQQREDNQ